jgi:hypothetical protein
MLVAMTPNKMLAVRLVALLTVRLTPQELSDFNIVARLDKSTMSEIVRPFINARIDFWRTRRPEMFSPEIADLLEVWIALKPEQQAHLISSARSFSEAGDEKPGQMPERPQPSEVKLLEDFRKLNQSDQDSLLLRAQKMAQKSSRKPRHLKPKPGDEQLEETG